MLQAKGFQTLGCNRESPENLREFIFMYIIVKNTIQIHLNLIKLKHLQSNNG